MDYDLVVRNGTIVDGSGSNRYLGDVAVIGDRIAALGKVDGKGRQEIDGEGHVVSPGFVDAHTHMDAQVFWDELGTNSCWHGITSVVMGNCGFTLAPAAYEHRMLAVRNLERAEDIAPASLEAGIKWSWTTFPEYLDAVDERPKGLNYAANIGHSAIRTFVMGEAAFEREADADEMALMADEVRAALRAGAVGFSTSRSTAHETSDDRPVASRLASWREVQALVGVLAEEGRGVFQISSEPASSSPDVDVRNEYSIRMKALALESRVPIAFGLFATERGRDQLDLIEDTIVHGGQMFGLTHCRGIESVMSFQTRLPFDKLPVWKELRALPHREQLTALADPDLRAKLIHSAHHSPFGRSIGAESRRPEYERMRVLRSPSGPNATVAAEAAARGIDPVELIIGLSIETDFKQLFVQQLFDQDESLLWPMLRHPATAMTFSDSGAHVSQIVDCSIQTFLLASLVRDRQIFTLEEAVSMISHRPAAHWGLADRGMLRVGMAADINVFDPTTVGPEMPTVVEDLPGGSRRYLQRASGFKATVVNGAVLLRDGQDTGERPGRLLRHHATR